MGSDDKRILDSVHGNIYIDRALVKDIIDTPEFQRLRRVEQTSTRAIFPSARHDRFIHSLGVYYVGTMIVKQLQKTGVDKTIDGIHNGLFKNLSDSYLIACLLHDIGHAPFSHTFEKYFGTIPVGTDGSKDQLKRNVLDEITNLYQGDETIVNIKEEELFNFKCDSNYHELTSALISIKCFNNVIPASLTNYHNTEFVARMIIGGTYQYNKDNPEVQIRNCFIDLLHGGIIDADRLDYVCRDVWASGYCTSSVDIERLISGLHIEINPSSQQYEVCFHANVLNEIESVLDVKDFQVKYILNHHTVLLEQYYLEQAALQMALHFTNNEGETNSERALTSILCKGALSEDGINLEKIRINDEAIVIRHMADDDLVNLMKLDNNEYYQKWSSRQYNKVALWKTRDEFFYFFELPRDISLGDKEDFLNALLPTLNSMGISSENVLCLKAEYKPRVELDNLKIRLSDTEMVEYTQLYRESEYGLYTKKSKSDSKKQVFYYIYVDANTLPTDRVLLKNRKIEILRALKIPIESQYNQDCILKKIICNAITKVLDSIKCK